MAKRTIKQRMINLCFRADTELIDLFYGRCKAEDMTRSEAFRIIFTEHILQNFLKKEQHETNDFKQCE